MKRIKIVLLGFLMGSIVSCGGESTTADPLAEGWAFFESHQYSDAHVSFVTAVESGINEGYVGLGWICIDLDSIPQADRYFGLAAGDSLIDGYAGWSAVAWARGNYASSILKADFVLRNDPGYLFDHQSNIDHRDMIWYQASAYLHLGNYSQCLDRIQELDNSFNTDVNAVNAGDVLAAKLETLAGQLI
jgi:hypothetical protein